VGAPKSHILRYLGFIWNSRTLELSWPPDKQAKLADLIDRFVLQELDKDTREPILLTPADKATILGLLKHGGIVADHGEYLSIRLQHSLIDETIKVNKAKRILENFLKRWWSREKIAISTGALADLKILRPTLNNIDFTSVWEKPIGLLIPREPTNIMKSDASTSVVGGWNVTLLFMWRLHAGDLALFGFKMRNLTRKIKLPDETHINLLEFLAMIINVVLTLSVLANDPILQKQQHIIEVLTDNTSALSWMQRSARSRRPDVRNMARFLQAIITYSTLTLRVQGDHIAGKLNTEADRLSRFTTSTQSWASVITPETQALETCTVFLVQSELLTILSSMIDNSASEDSFAPKTIERLISAPCILENGASLKDSRTSLSETCPKGKKSQSSQAIFSQWLAKKTRFAAPNKGHKSSSRPRSRPRSKRKQS
jgi:hypothetical protein